MMVIAFKNVNPAGKGQNVGYQYFLLFRESFQMAISVWSLKLA